MKGLGLALFLILAAEHLVSTAEGRIHPAKAAKVRQQRIELLGRWVAEWVETRMKDGDVPREAEITAKINELKFRAYQELPTPLLRLWPYAGRFGAWGPRRAVPRGSSTPPAHDARLPQHNRFAKPELTEPHRHFAKFGGFTKPKLVSEEPNWF